MERLAVIAFLVAAGCAPMTPEQCARADWYAEGEADALYHGIRPRFEQLARECRLAKPAAAEQAYMEGWAAGYSEHERRADRHM
ncbi:MAG TPA: hypothetical protein VFA72_14185 [Burkholderiales bacterium]|nr:hypothetical protein [Burkholderiales bacterium]